MAASGLASAWVDARRAIVSDDEHTRAVPDTVRTNEALQVLLSEPLDAGKVPVMGGFVGATPAGVTTTLGRGGSDTSGVALAAALKAYECQIYTDVDGVYTTDPRVVPEAQRLKKITFEEMLEMASLGSKVLQIRSVEFAGKYSVRLRVLSSLSLPELSIEEESRSGTLITLEEEADMEQALVSGIAFNRDEAKVTVLGVPDKPGVAYQILEPIAQANIEVDVIVQNIGKDGTTDFSFTVHRNELKKTMDVLKTCVSEANSDRFINATSRARIVAMLGFVEMLDTWSRDIRRVPRSKLAALMKLGGAIVRFLPGRAGAGTGPGRDPPGRDVAGGAAPAAAPSRVRSGKD